MKKSFLLSLTLFLYLSVVAQKPEKADTSSYLPDNQKKPSLSNDSTIARPDHEVINLRIGQTELIVLSLVDLSGQILNDWDSYIIGIKKRYKKNSVLVAVAPEDSKAKSDFMKEFTKNRFANMSLKEAYEKAVRFLEEKYPDSGVKHYLHLAEE